MKLKEPASERFLYQLWLTRSFAQTGLKTEDGRDIVVLERGVLNTDAGPDFRDALIIIDGEMRRGDVEIHSRPHFWYSHGHHNDENYNRVILHVVTGKSPPDFLTKKQDGYCIPLFNLDSVLEKSSEQLESENTVSMLREKTRICPLKKFDSETKRDFIRQAGLDRLKTKADRHTELRENDDWDQIFFKSLCQTLGYSKNSTAFLKLAQNCSFGKLRAAIISEGLEKPVDVCQACLFGTSGLLPAEPTHPMVRHLHAIWSRLESEFMPLAASEWIFFRLRPQNFPTRRIAGLASLVLRFKEAGFVDSVLPFIKALNRFPAKCLKEIAALFLVKPFGYWQDHYHFSSDADLKTKKSLNLIGKQKSRDIVINTVFTVLYGLAREQDDKRLEHMILELYLLHPAPGNNHISNYMIDLICSSEEKSAALFQSACFQQGMIQIYKNHCCRNRCPCF